MSFKQNLVEKLKVAYLHAVSYINTHKFGASLGIGATLALGAVTVIIGLSSDEKEQPQDNPTQSQSLVELVSDLVAATDKGLHSLIDPLNASLNPADQIYFVYNPEKKKGQWSFFGYEKAGKMSCAEIAEAFDAWDETVGDNCGDTDPLNVKKDIGQIVARCYDGGELFVKTEKESNGFRFFEYRGKFATPRTTAQRLAIAGEFEDWDESDSYENTGWKNVLVVDDKIYVVAKPKTEQKKSEEDSVFKKTELIKNKFTFFEYSGTLPVPTTRAEKLAIASEFEQWDKDDKYKETGDLNVKVRDGIVYVVAKLNSDETQKDDAPIEKVTSKLSRKNRVKTARWLASRYPEGNISLPKPDTDPTYGYGIFEMTNYYTSDCTDFKCWSGLEEECKSKRPACDSHRRDVFCGAIRMQGSGVCSCDGQMKAYKYTDFDASATKNSKKCEGGEAVDSDFRGESAAMTAIREHRTIAVNPNYIPYGSLVYIGWPEVPDESEGRGKAGKLFGGWYVAEDTGGAFTRLPKIDIYTGIGDAAKDIGMKVITRPFPKCVKKGTCEIGTDDAKVPYGPAIWVIPPEQVKAYIKDHGTK